MPGVRPKHIGEYRKRPVEERFAEKVSPEPNTGCHLWMGAADPLGYGRFGRRNRVYLAHRVAWELRHGPIPAGMCLCRRCDNPACVNPGHLFLGTRIDNNRDRDQKGRLWVGHRSKRRIAFEKQAN